MKTSATTKATRYENVMLSVCDNAAAEGREGEFNSLKDRKAVKSLESKGLVTVRVGAEKFAGMTVLFARRAA